MTAAASETERVPTTQENAAVPVANAANSLRISWPHVMMGAIGIAISLYSVHLHNLVKSGGSACGITETINCDKVLASRWAEIFGIPLGIYGAAFFALVVLTAISTLPAHTPMRQITLPRLAVAALGFMGSIALTAISWTQLHSLCPICLATHATTTTNFALALWGYFKTR
jgi:uncharacterized membrane protein